MHRLNREQRARAPAISLEAIEWRRVAVTPGLSTVLWGTFTPSAGRQVARGAAAYQTGISRRCSAMTNFSLLLGLLEGKGLNFSLCLNFSGDTSSSK